MVNELLRCIRGVRRNPGFSLLSIVTLALGIGISTAVFSVVNGVLLQPLQFRESDRIVSVNTRSADRPTSSSRITGGDFADVRSANKVFDAISVYYGGDVGVQLRDRAVFTGIYWVNPEFFPIFGQKPAALIGSRAVVGEAFAARNFGDAQRALGQSIRIENRVYAIASVFKTGWWQSCRVTNGKMYCSIWNVRGEVLRSERFLPFDDGPLPTQEDLQQLCNRGWCTGPYQVCLSTGRIFLPESMYSKLKGEIQTELH